MMSENENALVHVEGRDFKMPNFGNRVQHLKQQLENLNKGQDMKVINNAESSAEKSVHKLADSISDGNYVLESSQQDLTGNQELLSQNCLK